MKSEIIKRPRLAIIGTNGLPGKYGGWDQLVNHLTLHLKDRFDFLVYTSSYNAEPGLEEYNGVKLKIIKLKANGLQSIPYDILSLIHAVFVCDILFICGTSGCIFLPVIRLFNKKIILNPDGLEWKRKKWSRPVKWFLKMAESIGIRFSHVVVADNKRIQEYIKDEYGKSSILIEYGGDQVINNVSLSEATKAKYNIETNQYAFKVCRIEPENNIDMILEAFERTKTPLVLIGNWNYSNYGKQLKKIYARVANFRLLDPIYEQGALDEIRNNCGIYIHGHTVGGTNPSLVEAMNLGLCIVSFNVDFNIETTENAALYFETANDLVSIMDAFEKGSLDVDSYKSKMLEIARCRYTWRMITEKYASAFMS